MTDTAVAAGPDASPEPTHGWIWVELGNPRPQDVVRNPDTGETTRRDLLGPCVARVEIPYGLDGQGNHLYSFPDAHSDDLFACGHGLADSHGGACRGQDLADALNSLPDGPGKVATRRLLLQGHLAAPDGVTHLPNHAAFVALCHPTMGLWAGLAAPGTKPTFVHAYSTPGLEAAADEYARFLSEFWDCDLGRPANLEDTHYTDAGMPGVRPDPLGGIQMLHTSWGRDSQSLVQFAFGAFSLNGTATASSATSLTGGTETGGPTHVLNDAAGCIIVITSVADIGKWAFVKSNTTGTAPVYTVDQWYTPGSPGGAAAATPAATATYAILPGGAPARYVALTTDTTTPALAGAAGTADAPAATTALTSEITTAGGGLIRKMVTAAQNAHSAGAATVVLAPVFTANGSDALPAVVAKAALATSGVAGGGGLTYMTLVSPTVTFSASGDQATLTWSFTMT